ncbi:hypothetical protein, partial [Pseudomonas kuykendallii]|uniref:hypothetical protein n=1 Tax=Pseudomonas kuykendallii TaxID=1007099 RepID=UPI0028997231
DLQEVLLEDCAGSGAHYRGSELAVNTKAAFFQETSEIHLHNRQCHYPDKEKPRRELAIRQSRRGLFGARPFREPLSCGDA